MDVIYVFKRRTTNINIRYRLFMRKIKGDCDVIAYTDVVLTPKRKKEKKKKEKADGVDSKATRTAHPGSHMAEEAGGTPRGGGCSWVG